MMLPHVRTVSRSVPAIVFFAALLFSAAVFGQSRPWRPGPPLPVVPGAVGFGMNTEAGYRGTVVKVTNRNDSGAGSLREALTANLPGLPSDAPRVVIFEVAGNINLLSKIVMTKPFITIAGQTAPNPGIQITGAGIEIRTHDVLIQHIMIRVGTALGASGASTRDGIGIIAGNNADTHSIVIDHVSLYWSLDGLLDTFTEPSQTGVVRDITVRNSILAEALHCPPTGQPPCLHPDGDHSFGSLFSSPNTQVRNITVMRNVFARNEGRNPNLGPNATNVAAVNNVVYKSQVFPDAKIRVTGSSAIPTTRALVEGNVVITRSNDSGHKVVAVKGAGTVQLYIDGNSAIVPGPSGDTVHSPADDWDLTSGGIVALLDGHTVANTKVATRPAEAWPWGAAPILTANIESTVLASAGARPASRDADDARIINDVQTRAGPDFVDNPPNNGPQTLQPGTTTHNPPSSTADSNNNGYTDLEEWLHAKAAALEGEGGGGGGGGGGDCGSTCDPHVAVSDNFEDGNASGWTPLGTSAWSVVDAGTKVYEQSNLSGAAYSVLDASNWGNQVIEADVKFLSFNGADRWAGLFVRFTDPNNTYYITLRSSGVLALRKIVNGTFTTLGPTHPINVTTGTTYKLRLEAVGTSLKVYVNGNLVITATDTQFSSGRAAIGTFMARAQFDNVLVTPEPLSAANWLQDDFNSGNTEWIEISGPMGWSVSTDGVSQVLVQPDTEGNNQAIRKDSYWRDQSIEADVKITDAVGSNPFVALYVRHGDGFNTYYVKLAPAPGANQVTLKKLVNGGAQELATPKPFQFELNRTYRVRLEVVGSTLRVYVNGALIDEASDSTFVAGQVAMGTFSAAAKFDNVVSGPRAQTIMVTEDFEDGIANDWTPGGAQNWAVVTDGSSKVYSQTDNTGDAYSIFNGTSPDQSVEARVKVLSFNGTDRWVGIVARYTDPNNHYYITARGAPTNEVQLRKIVGGSFSVLGLPATFTPQLNTWYRFKLEVLRSQLRVYVLDESDSFGWKLLVEATDPSLTTGNGFGVRTFKATAEYDNAIATTP